MTSNLPALSADDDRPLVTVSWDAAVLVCKDCSKRSKAVKGLKAKDLVATIRKNTRAGKPRTRALVTGCLGLCPKRAMAVAFTGAGRHTRVVAVSSTAELEVTLSVLRS